MIAYQSLLITYKITRSKKPYYIAQKMNLKTPNENQIFPQRQAFTIPMAGVSGELSITRSGFCYRSARLFNSLPLQLRSCATAGAFKNGVKKWVTENVPIKPP